MRVADVNKQARQETAHDSLDTLVAAFLRQGGVIQQIATGVSGQSSTPPSRHIRLGKKQ